MNGQAVTSYIVPLVGGVQAVFTSAGLKYYRHADWLGTSRLALNTNGVLYGARAFAPFGEAFAETGTSDRVFTGQTQDSIPGQQGYFDFLLRQQSATQGRWMVPDPAGTAAVDPSNPQTWNRYAYVGNNPLSNVDPLGLDYWDEVGIGGVRGGFLPLDGYGLCDEVDRWFCVPIPIPFPIQIDPGGRGGGSGHPGSGGGTPPPGGGAPPVTGPGETNGIPNGLNVNFGGALGAIIPSATCGNLGPCPIGFGFDASAGPGIQPLSWWEKILVSFSCLGGMEPSYGAPITVPGAPGDSTDSPSPTDGQQQMPGRGYPTKRGTPTVPYNPNGSTSPLPGGAANGAAYGAGALECIKNVWTTWPKH